MSEFDLSGPAIQHPDGVIPDYDNPPTGNMRAIALFAFMMAVSTVFVVLRVYHKAVVARKLYIEDFLILCAYGNYWGATYSNIELINSPGFYVHQWNLKLGETIDPYYWIFVFGVFYSVVLACLKIAIVLEWCRIFLPAGPKTKSVFWWCSMGIITVQAGFGIAAIFLLSFQCVPHKAIWDFTITTARCLDLNTLQLTSSSIHLFSDVAIFLLPQHTIWTLNMSIQKKIGVAVVFGLGALAIVCAVFRMTATMEFGASEDKMYTIGNVILWATGEMTCGFFIVCAPPLPKILKNSYLGRKLRALLAIKSTKGTSGEQDSNLVTIGGSSGRNKGNHVSIHTSQSRSDAYYKIEEDAVMLKDFTKSGSDEHLHRNGDKAPVFTSTT